MNVQANLSRFWIRHSFKNVNSKSCNNATDKHGRELLAYILIVKKHRVKLKQTWVVESGLDVLHHDSDKDIPSYMYSFSKVEINDESDVCSTSQQGVFRFSRGCELKKVFVLSARVFKFCELLAVNLHSFFTYLEGDWLVPTA